MNLSFEINYLVAKQVCKLQSTRLEEQRSELPINNITMDVENVESSRRMITSNSGATVPDEDFFSLIMRVQGGRMEDQRAAVSVFVM